VLRGIFGAALTVVAASGCGDGTEAGVNLPALE